MYNSCLIEKRRLTKPLTHPLVSTIAARRRRRLVEGPVHENLRPLHRLPHLVLQVGAEAVVDHGQEHRHEHVEGDHQVGHEEEGAPTAIRI